MDLPKKLSNFDLNKECNLDFDDQDTYYKLEAIRELIYGHYPEDPSISFGSLLPIISPMFWETISGKAREEIMSLKYKGTSILEENYNRFKKEEKFWKNIIKIFLFDLNRYSNSLKNSCKRLSDDEKDTELKRRLKALKLFEDSIKRGEWPKLLLMVPTTELEMDKSKSFTVTPHMEVSVFRKEGPSSHHYRFKYSPKQTSFTQSEWSGKWSNAVDSLTDRSDWPKGLKRPEDIPLFSGECQDFNLQSLDIVRDSLISSFNTNDNILKSLESGAETFI